MKQRDIWLADLNAAQAGDQQDIRPVVVLSGNAMNSNLEESIVCPLSSGIRNYAGCLVIKQEAANGLDADYEIITFRITTISGKRLIRKLGEITTNQFELVKKGLNEILTY
jgi:mRNA interferase MazF